MGSSFYTCVLRISLSLHAAHKHSTDWTMSIAPKPQVFMPHLENWSFLLEALLCSLLLPVITVSRKCYSPTLLPLFPLLAQPTVLLNPWPPKFHRDGSWWISKESYSFTSLQLSLGLLSDFIMFWVCEPVLFYDRILFLFYMEHTQAPSNSCYVCFKYRCKPTTETNSSLKHEPWDWLSSVKWFGKHHLGEATPASLGSWVSTPQSITVTWTWHLWTQKSSDAAASCLGSKSKGSEMTPGITWHSQTAKLFHTGSGMKACNSPCTCG